MSTAAKTKNSDSTAIIPPHIGTVKLDYGPKRRRPKFKPNNEKWTFTIEGTYMGKLHNQTAQKPYRVQIIMPDNQVQKGALSQFLKHYAPRLMPRLYKDYEAPLTFEIVDADCTDPRIQAENISVMTRSQLLDYAQEMDLPIEQELYADADDLRVAIREASDPKTSETFERNQAIRRERMGDRLTDAVVALDYFEESISMSVALNKKRMAEEAEDL
jgi:hypothetical protein